MTTIPGIVAFRLADQNGTQALNRFRERPEIRQEIDRFTAGLRNIKTLDDFYQNERVYRFVLESANLKSDIPFRGKVRRLLNENPTSNDSLLTKLTDDRFKDLATILRFDASGVNRLKRQDVQNKIIDNFVKARFEESLGTQNAAVPTARYFRERIGDVTSEYGILGDAKLRDVVLTTLGLPRQIAVQPVESQAELIKSRIDLKQFQNPAFVERFLQRFLVAKDQEAAQAGGVGGGQSYLLGVFGNRSSNLNLIV